MQGTQSALVVPAPAADPVVATWRGAYDPAAAAGVPAHLTVLYPFLHPHRLTKVVMSELRALFADQAPFEFRFARVDALSDVLFLAPDQPHRFVQMTEAVHERWPDAPPYAGEFDELIPHLTVGLKLPLHARWHAEAMYKAQLPIGALAREVQLLVERREGWVVADIFPLSG